MAMSLNKVLLIGNLTKDPEVRTTPGGQPVATITVATNFSWKDQNGAQQEKTEFHTVILWRRLAEIAQQWIKKGSKIYLEGRIQTRSWDDATTGTKKYRTEIIGDSLIMLDRAGAGSAGTGSNNAPTGRASNNDDFSAAQEAPKMEEINLEDIPF